MNNNLYEVKLKMIKEMKDNLTSKLRDYTIATSFLAATALGGCATTHQQVVPNAVVLQKKAVPTTLCGTHKQKKRKPER